MHVQPILTAAWTGGSLGHEVELAFSHVGLVHRIDLLDELLLGDGALELECGCELFAFHREVGAYNYISLDRRSRRRAATAVFVRLLDRLGDRLGERGRLDRIANGLDCRVDRLRKKLVGARKLARRANTLQCDDGGVELAFVSDHHNVGDDRAQLLHVVLERHRRNVLAARTDDQLLVPDRIATPIEQHDTWHATQARDVACDDLAGCNDD